MGHAEEVFFFSRENFLYKLHGFFPKDILRTLRDEITYERESLSADETDERFRAAQKVGIAPDAVRLNQKWFEIWKKADLSIWPDKLNGYNQIIYPPQIRTVAESQYFVPWHQDEAYIKALGSRGHKNFVVCFLPLEEDLNGRPSVQFARDPQQKFVEHITRPEYLMNQFDIRTEDIPGEEKFVTLPMELGDVFLFGKYVFHRSHCCGEQVGGRRSMEFRFTDRESTLCQKDYYDLGAQQFYFKE